MNRSVEYWAWNGLPIVVEVYDGTGGAWDVSTIASPAEHPTGMVPEGETHYLCRFPFGSDRTGFWATEEAFHDYAEPLATEAIGFDE